MKKQVVKVSNGVGAVLFIVSSSSEIASNSDLDPSIIYWVFPLWVHSAGLGFGFRIAFASLCALVESPELSQETWILTLFKTNHQPLILGDTSILPSPWLSEAQSCSSLAVLTSVSVLAEPRSFNCPHGCPSYGMRHPELQSLCFTDSSTPPRAWPRGTLRNWQYSSMVKNMDFRLHLM